MNYGLNWEKELAEQSPEDWQFGATSPQPLFTVPFAERRAYLPKGELQAGQEDFQDCASRSPNNILAPEFTYGYQKKLLNPENLKWLEEKKYPDANGVIDFSDRYVAIRSGTTRQGNSLKAPLDAIHNYGLIPKWMLPADPSMTWEQYHDPAEITQAMKDLGEEFARRFTINYERVYEPDFEAVLKTDEIDVGAFAWPAPVNGVYPRTGNTPNHAFKIFEPKYYAFDNYYDTVDGDWIKRLAPDYDFVDYGYRVFISKETAPSHIFLKNLGFQMMDEEVKHLQKALVSLGYSIPHAVTNVFGTETRSALWQFQVKSGIADDGTHFGPRTRYALNTKLNPTLPFGGSAWTYLAALFSAQ